MIDSQHESAVARAGAIPWRHVPVDFAALRAHGIDKSPVDFEKAHTFPASRPKYQPRAPEDLFQGFRLPSNRRVWGYVHVPFCNYSCGFCFYAKNVAKDRARLVDRYLENLARELDFALDRLGVDAFEVKDFYVGGGTPTALTAEQLARFLETLRERIRFAPATLASVEASPESLTSEKIALLKDFGFSRFSVGMQSEQQQFLDLSARQHTVAEAIAAYELLRNNGVKHINIDLIYGFPGETPDMWESSVERVARQIDPESFTLYYLRYVPHTSFNRQIAKERRTSWESLAAMRARYMDVLEHQGYERCRPHFFRKPLPHVRRYHGAPTLDHTNYGSQLGFGPSAYSHLGHQVGRSASNLAHWFERVEQRGFGTVEGSQLTLQDRLTRRMLKDLCNRGYLLHDDFEQEFGQSVGHFFGLRLRQLADLGLIEEQPDRITLTRQGILVDEEIARIFYPS